MHYYEVAPRQIFRADQATFTYSSNQLLQIGTIVQVEVGKKLVIGIIVKATTKPMYQTKTVNSVLIEHTLPEQIVTLAVWLSRYYATPLATVLQTILPTGLQKKRRQQKPANNRPVTRDQSSITLTSQQQNAIKTVSSMSVGSALLYGVTGSGKTHVYIELAKKCMQAGQSVIVLVPEIALTPQLVSEFSRHFEDIILTHSRQSEAERHIAWLAALHSDQPRVVIGPRSALFMPLRSIGLIVIDEAHEPSFKQEQSPRYSALRAASVLADAHKAKLVIGSATPSITDYFLALHAGRPIIRMDRRAQTAAVPADTHVIDMTKRSNFKKHRFLSDALLHRLDETFASGQQALIFHNRRGSASSTLCENCGWQAMCAHCFVPLTLHSDDHHLRCHICGLTETVPTSCPVCHETDIIHKGIGTKLIERELSKLFPNKKIMRFDGDSDHEDSVEQRYAELYSGQIDLIIGTQVIAKGLDLPKLRTVGVVQADTGLSLPDYTSSERTFQLLAQVVGRVGRSHHPTQVIVQSYQPTHPAIIDGITQDYEHFYKTTLIERRRGAFPPYTYLLKLTCSYKTEAAAIKNSQKLAQALRATLTRDIQILGPTPAFYERQRDSYRWQLVLKSARRAPLVDALQHLPASHWQYELDPTSLL